MTTTSHAPLWRLQDRLARALDEADVSVTDMAAELGVHRNTVSNYLHGRRPSKAVLRVWSLRCGVPYEWIERGTIDGEVTDAHTACDEREYPIIPGQLALAVSM